METNKIIDEIISLPVEDRTLIADSILKSLNPVNLEIEKKWYETAKNRLDEIKLGKVKAVPGNKVFEKIRQRYSQ